MGTCVRHGCQPDQSIKSLSSDFGVIPTFNDTAVTLKKKKSFKCHFCTPRLNILSDTLAADIAVTGDYAFQVKLDNSLMYDPPPPPIHQSVP